MLIPAVVILFGEHCSAAAAEAAALPERNLIRLHFYKRSKWKVNWLGGGERFCK